ncbi:hypothetical protein TGME49_287170 [Toxoplasma gondii ME49]|uniref:Uncharacterized protein n=8 Tax=Toxoplasma gondii TaxID=5811 RepID=S7UP90_TOXGG|nr:hypothetical protein TGME49_287170 [Toxoplasma gondii ME49]EPR59492.1 hypothetical protein TGGT1_287170 [Toxoplasma gondii GT1]KAF4643776.1 hypothetical protein TGRH88_025320 [Toxoplasma gondii]KFG54857.1 hypothetical protein TGFOU_287170 [Toxoplasma gondii FOU]KFG63175.1 hypothetical protein TGRUB_287170 [Toxoplasma gondii RUB]KYF43745.1 hypothetical protein TGARI_287170 [Toxoplasma gondii ARI]PUA86160.1 hypothetical protein TGBR9_287170 [Toxoplasma gondii TgCATBr9]RQX69701.1 hypothetica|eukprot:XP_002369313.1 hypothetical protein TGME49_287170 [Toxoplasma gondii ME49]
MEDYRQRHRDAYERRVAEQKAREERERQAASQRNGSTEPAVAPSSCSSSNSQNPPQDSSHVCCPSSSAFSQPRSSLSSSSPSSSAALPSGSSPAAASSSHALGVVDSDRISAEEAASLEEARRLQRQFEAEMEGIRPPDDTYEETLISEDIHPSHRAWWERPSASPIRLSRAASMRSDGRRGQQPPSRQSPQDGEEDDAALARRLQEEEYSRHREMSPVPAIPSGGSPSRTLSAHTPPQGLASRGGNPASPFHMNVSPGRCVIDVDRESDSEVQVVSSRPNSPSPASPPHTRQGDTSAGSVSPWGFRGTSPALDASAGGLTPGSAAAYPAASPEAEVFAAAGIDIDSDEAIMQATIAQSLVDM